MSIPLDKLYHYIESIAQDIRGDNVLIYRFFPHGSKKLEDLKPITEKSFLAGALTPTVYCYDQEPLNFELYNHCDYIANTNDEGIVKKYKHLVPYGPYNIKNNRSTIYDHSLLIHSEKRSKDVELYRQIDLIPVYYWSHGLIAIDWYRYGKYEKLNKNIKKLFLIYNRAWSGTREYRLKFIDLLIKHKLVDECLTSFNPVEPELGIHYTQHKTKAYWLPDHTLEYYVPRQPTVDGTASADYDINDYNSTEFEVVLETLFDDQRIQLTEKILRPIAMGQPFLLAATHGSLEYLRSYGFRTFASVIDESYDTIEDPVLRLEAIVKIMKEIAEWGPAQREQKMILANQIALYNRKHFYSDKFFNQIIDELKINLKDGLTELENKNTSAKFLNRRKQIGRYKELVNFILSKDSRENMALIVQKAKAYYMRTLPK